MLLPEAFAVASISGLWLPQHWSHCQSSLSRMLYHAYTLTILTVMVLIVASQLMALMFLTNSVDDLAEASFLFLTAINAGIKGLNMLLRRQKIIDLADLFVDKKCIPRNVDEFKICLYYDKMARYMTLSTLGLGLTTATCLCVWPLLQRGENYIFTMRAWQPYEITSEIRYYITQTHQMIALMVMLFWDGTSDFLCPGFMIQICSQLRLMHHRLSRIPDDSVSQSWLVKQTVQHHLHIVEMKKRLEVAFAPAILSQYMLSALVLCNSIYQLISNSSDIVQTMVVFMYASNMSVELLMYCWTANEVYVTSLQFSDIVGQSDWTKLDMSNRRGLMIMMLRSTIPIRITCGPLITLSTDSYTRILKLSYSAFNVLQRSH